MNAATCWETKSKYCANADAQSYLNSATCKPETPGMAHSWCEREHVREGSWEVISAVTSAAVCSQLCSECSKGHFPDGEKVSRWVQEGKLKCGARQKEAHSTQNAAQGKSNSTQREAVRLHSALLPQHGLKDYSTSIYLKKKQTQTPQTIQWNQLKIK